MGYVSKTSGSKVVALSEGYEATIRVLRKADEDALQVALLGSAKSERQYVRTDDSSTVTARQTVDNAAYTRELLVRGVAAWTLDDDQGTVLPINGATVELLSGPDMTTLVAEIVALGKPLSAPKGAGSASA